MFSIRCVSSIARIKNHRQLPHKGSQDIRFFTSLPPSPFCLFLLAILVSQDLFLFEVSWNNVVEFYLFLLVILVSQDLFLFEVSWNNAVEFYLFLLGGHCATGVCLHVILSKVYPIPCDMIIDEHSTSSDIILPLLHLNRLSSHPC